MIYQVDFNIKVEFDENEGSKTGRVSNHSIFTTKHKQCISKRTLLTNR